jgi:uncharacterized protein (TIGR03435 family)
MKGPALVASLLVLYAATAAVSATQVQGQGSAALAFEVASVKPSNPDASSPLSALPLILPSGAGRITASNTPLKNLVLGAYELQDFQLSGGPSWLTSRRWDINAKAENPKATMKELMAMLKTLLADRFQLKAHMETRDVPIGALVMARSDGKLGPKLTVSTAKCPTPEELSAKAQDALSSGGGLAALQSLGLGQGGECSIMPTIAANNPSAGMGLGMKGQPISTLVALLTQFTGRPVQDRTGLTGRYDFELTFDPEVLMRLVSNLGINVPAGTLPQSNAPSLLTALQEQLGLKLENDKAPGQVLVIDSAELPTPD